MQAPKAVAPPADFEPMLIGEHAALDFLNSNLAPAGETLDFLHDGVTLARWLSSSGVVADNIATVTRTFSHRQLDQMAVEARELREWFRARLLRWQVSGERAVRKADIDWLNVLMSKSPLTQVIVRGPAGVELRAQRDPANPATLMAELAATCADLLAHQRHDNVHKCENPACTLVFVDNKRGPRRRWCSMAVCGNRMKVAAHRMRRRDG